MSDLLLRAALRDALEYFPETGVLIWKVSPCNAVATGTVAGSLNGRGYWQIEYHHRKYLAHRVAWLLMTGDWPKGHIDHRNCDTSDNRWTNLREATRTQNMANRRSRHRFPKGVSLHPCGKFQAQIRSNGKQHYLGLFHTAEEAATAYATAAKKYFGEFARVA